MKVFRPLLTCALALALLPCSAAEDAKTDYHLSDDRARGLYAISAFAHGHRHGYEEGFKHADQDLHMGYQRRTLKPGEVPKTVAYRKNYGDKNRFRQGFVYGFLAGYADSFDGHPFRLPTVVDSLAVFAHENAARPPQKDSAFEKGLLQGYVFGLNSSMEAFSVEAGLRQATECCEKDPRSVETGFCRGYEQGFLFGNADRNSLSPPERTAVAQNAISKNR